MPAEDTTETALFAGKGSASKCSFGNGFIFHELPSMAKGVLDALSCSPRLTRIRTLAGSCGPPTESHVPRCFVPALWW